MTHLTDEQPLAPLEFACFMFSQAKMEKTKQQHMYFMFLTPHLVNIPGVCHAFVIVLV